MYEAKIHIPVERQLDSLSKPAHMDVDGLEKQLFNMILATRNLQYVSMVGKFEAGNGLRIHDWETVYEGSFDAFVLATGELFVGFF
jgi:hypothetical protein